jgi:hypothetical protein
MIVAYSAYVVKPISLVFLTMEPGHVFLNATSLHALDMVSLVFSIL